MSPRRKAVGKNAVSPLWVATSDHVQTPDIRVSGRYAARLENRTGPDSQPVRNSDEGIEVKLGNADQAILRTIMGLPASAAFPARRYDKSVAVPTFSSIQGSNA